MELTTSDEALGIFAYRPVFHAEFMPGVWWDAGELVEVGEGGAGEDESAHDCGVKRLKSSSIRALTRSAWGGVGVLGSIGFGGA